MLNNKLLTKLSMLIIFTALSACQQGKEKTENKISADKHKAITQKIPEKKEAAHKILSGVELAQKYLLIDTHVDVPYRLQEKYEDVSQATADGNFDYPRAKKGGLNALFMSIYLPSELQKTAGASKKMADHLIDLVEKTAKESPHKFAMAPNTKTLEDNFHKGLISFAMGMENGSGLEGKLENLQHFYVRGIRYITLAHAKTNNISDSSYDPNKTNHGLSVFGKKLIPEMNRLGVLVDVSHISDDAFYQVMELSQTPVIASHSAARFFTPGWERNMSDDMLKLLAEKGGVIQVNFGSSFITKASLDQYEQYKKIADEYRLKNNISEDSDEMKTFSKDYFVKHPKIYATMDQVVAQFKHIIDLVGIDHVGIGSDFDGVGDSLPLGLKDVSQYPNLIQALSDLGLSEKGIEKVMGGNLLRVWKENEDYAKKMHQTALN